MSKFWQAMMMVMMVVFLLFLPSMTVAELEQIINKKPMLYELSSRDEMVQMAGYGEEKLSTVLVTGTVLCQSCHLHPQPQPQLRAWPISGALVDVTCKTHGKGKSGSAQAKTDEYGDFIIELPSHLHGVPNLEKMCTVKVIGIPKKSMCRPAFVKKHKRLRLSSVGNGIRTYTAGKIRFQHITSEPLKSCITKKATTITAKQNSLTVI